MHVKQLASAIGACAKRDIECEAAHVASSAADSILGFKGWKDRTASYDYVLRKWNGERFEELSAE